MLPISIQSNLRSQFGEEAKKAMIEGLNLSEAQESFVWRYYELSIRPTISDKDVSQMEYIWEKAADDPQLAEGLGLIDDLHPPCLTGEDLISDNQNVRACLSDHLPLVAQEKLKRSKGELEELETDNPFMTLFCPDGSGMVQIGIQTAGFVHIKEDQRCSRCYAKFADHEKFIQVEKPICLAG